jgi:hypothetical protein
VELDKYWSWPWSTARAGNGAGNGRLGKLANSGSWPWATAILEMAKGYINYWRWLNTYYVYWRWKVLNVGGTSRSRGRPLLVGTVQVSTILGYRLTTRCVPTSPIRINPIGQKPQVHVGIQVRRVPGVHH